jgi:hypothetical protein
MDVRKQGLTVLFLRLQWMANPYQRRKMDNYMHAWVRQVRMTERALARAGISSPEKRIACR